MSQVTAQSVTGTPGGIREFLPKTQAPVSGTWVDVDDVAANAWTEVNDVAANAWTDVVSN
jgi:hypothetical protein